MRNGKPVENNLATGRLARTAIVIVSQHGDHNAPANLAAVAPARYLRGLERHLRLPS